MTNDHLATVGTSLAAIGRRIAERVSDSDGTPSATIFDECLERELISLRSNDQAQLAEAVATIRNPIARMLKEGW